MEQESSRQRSGRKRKVQRAKVESKPSMTDRINEILGIDDIFKAPARMMEILLDKPLRESIFNQFLELHNYKLDEDFWHKYFQDEAAQRKKMGQDFTPPSVCGVLAELVGSETEEGIHYEPTAGTGGMIIAKWHRGRVRHTPFSYRPSRYVYICEELSDRAFPFLVFNMAIRGMNGAAAHCDSLERTCYGVFFIQNDDDNPGGFSSVNVMPYSKAAEDYFKVSFTEKKYPAHWESPNPFVDLEEK